MLCADCRNSKTGSASLQSNKKPQPRLLKPLRRISFTLNAQEYWRLTLRFLNRCPSLVRQLQKTWRSQRLQRQLSELTESRKELKMDEDTNSDK